MTKLISHFQLSLKSEKHEKDPLNKGFTLVELMIVIVIVGILSAVALPNFLGTRNKAEAQTLIGSMAGFAKACGANMIVGDNQDLPSVPATITFNDGTTSAASALEYLVTEIIIY